MAEGRGRRAHGQPDPAVGATASFGSGGVAVQKSGPVTAMGEDSAGDIFVQNGTGTVQTGLGEYSPREQPTPR